MSTKVIPEYRVSHSVSNGYCDWQVKRNGVLIMEGTEKVGGFDLDTFNTKYAQKSLGLNNPMDFYCFLRVYLSLKERLTEVCDGNNVVMMNKGK